MVNDYEFVRNAGSGDMRLDELFEIFIYAKLSEGKAERTIESYTEYYRYFCRYLDACGIAKMFSSVTPSLLRNYMGWMLYGQLKWNEHPHKSEKNMTKGLSPVTVNTKMKTLKAMFRFLHEDGVIPHNPAARVGKAREPENEIRILTVEEMQRLLRAPDKDTYPGFRDFVAMHVLIDSFARAGELLSLKVSNVDFNRGVLHFEADIVKTRKGRSVPVSAYTLQLLTILIHENRNFESEYIFLTKKGKPLRDDRLRERVKLHAKNAGIDANVFLHQLRHTAATMFMDKGGSLRHLAAMLGHTDLRSTMRYTTPTDRGLKEQHAGYSVMNDVLGVL
ncbi:tyrosine-type recombinase/integrase [Paenibacillus apii]|uniref:tyrosine-type recombinase/integrase n=1 Tax=Paenibacillus apii TaxID=1850370 RepID=UPI00143BA8DA|nr:tyrosine-type recombinase/integrase [Paenibacillus apii]NJJ38408.1 tyrosine-type recombinase/integrase [Paenibacillus apii]